MVKWVPYQPDPEITGEREIPLERLGLRQPSLKEPFIKGPLRLGDLAAVVRLPGKYTLAVWLLLQYRSDIGRGSAVTIPNRLLKSWNIDKNAKTRALKQLERAGLITIERPSGYSLKIRPVRARKRKRAREGKRRKGESEAA
jgi:hypothetical protein